MILGEPVGNISKDDFYSFFCHLNLFTDIEGITIIPSCTPILSMLPVDRETLEWKRSFFLAYFPMNLWNDFATMLLAFITPVEDMEFSLTSATPNKVNPIILQSGTKLFVWKHNILMLLDDKSTFYIFLDSRCSATEDEYLYRRIDIWVCGSLEVQAKLMSTACSAFESVSC